MTDRDTPRSTEYEGRHHVVRPGWAWSGLALMVAGSVVAGVGFVLVSVAWIVAGAAVLALGVGAAWFGGLLYDIESRGASLGDEHRVVPGSTARAEDDVLRREVAEEERELTDVRARQGIRPTWRQPAAGLMLAAAGWLVLTQGAFYDQTPVGRDGTLRVTGFAIVVALPALYLLVRSSLVPAAVCALGGLGLLTTAVLAEHGTTRSVVSEALCGAVVLLGAAVAAAPALRALRARRGAVSARNAG